MVDILTITGVEKLDLVAEAEFVDLGLSVKCAKWNLGATKETDYGDYFAWGETAAKTSYSWGTYFDTTDGGETFVKYSTEKKELDLVDDAANASLGGSVTMPDGTRLPAANYQEYLQLLRRMNVIFSKPIKAEVSMLGRNGIVEKTNEYNRVRRTGKLG